jgi:hypothetical protein
MINLSKTKTSDETDLKAPKDRLTESSTVCGKHSPPIPKCQNPVNKPGLILMIPLNTLSFGKNKEVAAGECF